MNKLVLLAVALCAFCYFGGNYCPAVLKKNKKILLGGSIALLLCSFMGLEGMVNDQGVVDVDGGAGERSTESGSECPCGRFDFLCKMSGKC